MAWVRQHPRRAGIVPAAGPGGHDARPTKTTIGNDVLIFR